jgi:hypothetical protein
MMPTMCWICTLSALPLPTNASFTSVAAYSCTGRSRRTTAQIAAPRAWPNFNAESGLRAMNTRSMATSSGR